MLFKLSQKIRFNALILSFIFSFCGLSSCTNVTPHGEIELNFVPGDFCSEFNFTYTDRLSSYKCNGFENYSGLSSYEVAGICTTTVANLTQPALGIYYQQDQILIDCASGALTSFDTIVHTAFGGHPNALLISDNGNSGVFSNANVGDKLSVQVRCDAHGAKRDLETLSYTLTAAGSVVFNCVP